MNLPPKKVVFFPCIPGSVVESWTFSSSFICRPLEFPDIDFKAIYTFMIKLLFTFVITVSAVNDFQTTIDELSKKYHLDDITKRADAIAQAVERKKQFADQNAPPEQRNANPRVYHKTVRNPSAPSFLETDASAPQALSPKEFSDWLTNMYAKVDARREDNINRLLKGELV